MLYHSHGRYDRYVHTGKDRITQIGDTFLRYIGEILHTGQGYAQSRLYNYVGMFALIEHTATLWGKDLCSPMQNASHNYVSIYIKAF